MQIIAVSAVSFLAWTGSQRAALISFKAVTYSRLADSRNDFEFWRLARLAMPTDVILAIKALSPRGAVGTRAWLGSFLDKQEMFNQA